ncbi:hypothetical protein [Sphingomonas sp. NFX23]|uniref:hypothetical protein n=1 Tax=Sphingomonas sp. NFX23 TaxID=2819532 RepID=UPI003CF88CF7
MQELNALHFVGTVAEVRRLCTVLEQDMPGANESFAGPVRQAVSATLESLCQHLLAVGAQSAWVASDRLAKRLADPNFVINFAQLRAAMNDVESRFADHLSFIRLYVLTGEQLPLLGSPTELLGEDVASKFTSVWFDCEEAAKCLVVLRPTASVFHSMRMLEIAIRAFAAKLSIPNPVKPSQRNWAIFLKLIRAAIEEQYPSAARMPGSEGAYLEGLFATLDAVKNPWRNEVMHVEGVYTDAEARFIFICVINLFQKMAVSFDERGRNKSADAGITEAVRSEEG